MLLHNQWPIRPVGAQIELGNFPAALAVDPSGRYAAIAEAGSGKHDILIVDLKGNRVIQTVPVHQAYGGIAFTPDGRRLVVSGGADNRLNVFAFDGGIKGPLPGIGLQSAEDYVVTGGVAAAPDGRSAFYTQLFAGRVGRVDLATGASAWLRSLDPPGAMPARRPVLGAMPNIDGLQNYASLVQGSDPLGLAWDRRRERLYVSLWGESAVAVLDGRDGHERARWATGLHPNELVLAPDGKRLFVSNGGLNTVTVLATADGRVLETLTSAIAPQDLPGSTPDSLALTRDGRRLFVANASNNNVAVFDVSQSGHGRAEGFIPTAWFPIAVRLTPDERRLLVLSARGTRARPNNVGETTKFALISGIYRGSLGVVDLPRGGGFDRALAGWTAAAEQCHPPPPPAARAPGDPIPPRTGGATPIRYVIYIIKENRTYDQIFGDLPEGRGDPQLCLFPEAVTPNLHRLARQFVLLDNFYANAEVSASGHEWSTGGYASEFVEKTWPINYDHAAPKEPYTSEGRFAAAVPALGYLWDQTRKAGVSYRDYGEFVTGGGTAGEPSTALLPALKGHVDPLYRGWDLDYSDLNRAERFIDEAPPLRADRRHAPLPDPAAAQRPHPGGEGGQAAAAGDGGPERPGAGPDDRGDQPFPLLAANGGLHRGGRRPERAGPHRCPPDGSPGREPYVRRHAVDSTPYTTCSMLATMECVLGMAPMSQFDAVAPPMRASFQAAADLTPFESVPARTNLEELNPPGTRAAKASARMNFRREDANDDFLFNRVLWQAMRGDGAAVPAPVHAGFVRPIRGGDDDDDG